MLTSPDEQRSAARVYSVELIGDHSLITCQLGEDLLIVKADKPAHMGWMS